MLKRLSREKRKEDPWGKTDSSGGAIMARLHFVFDARLLPQRKLETSVRLCLSKEYDLLFNSR